MLLSYLSSPSGNQSGQVLDLSSTSVSWEVNRQWNRGENGGEGGEGDPKRKGGEGRMQVTNCAALSPGLLREGQADAGQEASL